MPTIIDNVELDETNVEFNYALDFVKHTDRLVYLTGKAGTGKTTFLKYLRETTNKNTVIVAPTGVAAINAGGQTIHSFFQIRPSIYVPNDKRLRTKPDIDDTDKSTIYDHFKYFKERLEIIRGLDLLIIDEISMVRCDLLDVVDRLLRVFRRRENEAFGGVQVILIGDTFQLAPIAKSDEWDILKQFYKTEFFFGSKVIEQNKPVYIELKKIYRQNEQEFIDLLNRVRVNQINQIELNALNAKYNPAFSPNGNANYITLATHNKIVDSTNLTKLSELTTELKVYEAAITGTFPDNIMPTDRLLQLKEGAQIMFIKNDKGKRFYNGKIAKIDKLDDKQITAEFSDGTKIAVDKEVWNNIKYNWNEKDKKIEEEIIGTFTQFPLKLAWAITVHKSQGLTFEKVIADLGAAFTSGQVYVALSRCTTFSGLVLKTRIDRHAIITDPQVLLFAQNETPSTLIVQELNSGKADYYYKKSRDAIKALDVVEAYNNFLKAIKFRNDIETDTFKRYIHTTFTRIASFKEKADNLFKQFAIVDAERNTLTSTNDTLEKANKEQKQKLTDQNKSIKLSLSEIKSLEATIKNLNTQFGETQKKNEILKNEKASLNTSLVLKNREIQDLENYIKGEEAKTNKIISEQEAEIKRLQKLKWYQRLFGRT
jgi:nucleoside-triphosphatase THEP1